MNVYRKTVPLISMPLFALDQAKHILISLRPKHWIKNLFVFCPLLFSGHFRNIHEVYLTTAGFVAFSLAASSVYLFNDIIDRDRDQKILLNKDRPIAAGKTSISTAALTSLILQLLAVIFSSFLSSEFLALLILYVFNNVVYTMYIKNKVIVDVISIAFGFVIRILAGAALTHVEVSHWLLICTFNVSLLLGFGKRRSELLNARGLRPVNEIYTDSKLDHMMSVSAAVTLFSYMLYAVSPETINRFGGDHVIYTVPFVVYGIFRYVAKIQEGKCRDPIHLIYSDKAFTLNIFLWMVSIIVILFKAYPI